MEQWLTENFEAYGSGVQVYTDANSFTVVDPSNVAESLGSTVPPTYDALSNLPIAKQGWQKIFDQWKADGKVS